ncbi:MULTISPECIES: divergent polysaccharide deacetylase family protein [unclassified Roseovarius]|uniref:divergent polysaccharide deacetylase family protein n=1 Tax=unclassified Roseovarius TaxID=2614913 RepID=UPI00273FCE32|nr:polysaccharide deacteylase family 2 protein [Roseovarius sp. MMSF_3350]
MLRGFLAGVVSGTALSGVLLAGASVLSGMPGDTPPEATPVEVPAGSEFDQSRDDDAASLPQLQDTPTPDAVPQVTAPEPDDLSSLDGADTTSSGLPETGQPEVGLSAPEAPQGDGALSVGTEEPVLPNPQAQAPEAPAGEDDLSISTEPAQPVLPEAEEESAAFPEPQAEPEGADAREAESDATPEADSETQAEAETEVGEETTPDTTPESTPESPASDVATPEPQEDPVVDAPQNAAEPATPSAEAGEDAAEATTEAAETGTIGDIAEGVTTDRLPTAIDPEPQPEPETGEVGADDAAEETAAETLPPVERFAAEFENPENKPLMSIILIDDGTSPIGPAALGDFPYPLSFAVDASRPDAAETAARYRDAGMEVLALVNLPQNAAASDAETSMSVFLEAVPEAVAVFEGTGTGLQSSREAAEQLAPILKDSGHGLVMFPNGLNTAQKLIAREGVPSATVFRDFDSNGQSAAAVRRFLDQAAFRAGQEEGGVIMVGRLRPDTISALLLWGLQDRAASVALAPVSAVLTAE